MKHLRSIGTGLVITIILQFTGLLIFGLAPAALQKLDPANNVLYTSIGLLFVLIYATNLALNRKYLVLLGAAFGILLWLPFLLLLMGLFHSPI
jgi:hypothetical protein